MCLQVLKYLLIEVSIFQISTCLCHLHMFATYVCFFHSCPKFTLELMIKTLNKNVPVGALKSLSNSSNFFENAMA